MKGEESIKMSGILFILSSLPAMFFEYYFLYPKKINLCTQIGKEKNSKIYDLISKNE
jgi:hypothetical protein